MGGAGRRSGTYSHGRFERLGRGLAGPPEDSCGRKASAGVGKGHAGAGLTSLLMHDPYRVTLASLPAMRRHSEQKPYPVPHRESTTPRRDAMKITTMAASLAVSGPLLVGCAGGSKTAHYNTCKTMGKSDRSKA